MQTLLRETNPSQDDGLVAREAAPVAQPEAAPEPLKARTEQFIQIQQQAHSWADTQAWQVPSKEQLTFAHSCFPQQAWDQNFYGINDYPQGWDARIWNYYYLYYYYQQYNFQWTDYWPNCRLNDCSDWSACVFAVTNSTSSQGTPTTIRTGALQVGAKCSLTRQYLHHGERRKRSVMLGGGTAWLRAAMMMMMIMMISDQRRELETESMGTRIRPRRLTSIVLQFPPR